MNDKNILRLYNIAASKTRAKCTRIVNYDNLSEYFILVKQM